MILIFSGVMIQSEFKHIPWFKDMGFCFCFFLNTCSPSFTILLDRITRSRLAGDPPDVSITPRMGHIGLLDFHRAEDAIEEGAKAVDRIVPELMEVIGMLARRDSPGSAPIQAEAS